VNIVGGLIIGVGQQGMDFSDAAKIYTILSIGDGLVGQIPALIVSVSAGFIVTKVSTNLKLSEEISNQTMAQWRPLALAAFILFTMALVPGFPKLPFLFLATLFAVGAYRIAYKKNEDSLVEASSTSNPDQASQSASVETVPPMDVLEIEVGYDLVPLVDQKSGGEFPSRIVGIRRQMAHEMGVVLAPVHIRDNLKLKSNEYRIFLKGSVIAQGELMAKHWMALDPGSTTRVIEGIPTKDPTFGLNALWVPEKQKENAVIAGYTVVDLASIMATHLVEVVRHNLHELFGWQDLAKLLDSVKVSHPKLVSDLIPEMLSFGTVLKVLQNLLHERVSIRDFPTILEALAEHAGFNKDSQELTEHVRISLGRSIAQHYMSSDQTLYALTLSRTLEDKLLQSLVSQGKSGSQLMMDPNLARTLVEQIGQEAKKNVTNERPPVVLTSQQVRPHLYKLIERFIPNLAVLAHSEVAGHVRVKPVGMIGEAI
jgi:flagellar biosynthesis protein FlhA